MEQWSSSFNPEIRRAGIKLFNEGSVKASRPSDTEIQAYLKTYKVLLKSPAFDSTELTASCTCADGKKGKLCKHMFATLLQAENRFEDFLEGKKEISASVADVKPKAAPSAARLAVQAEFKEKQAVYRKVQYQKQKLRRTKIKLEKQNLSVQPDYPADVQSAIEYFSQNGFEMQSPLQAEDVKLAKKKLSRVFHPDRGGTNSEFIELNHKCEVLLSYISTENGG